MKQRLIIFLVLLLVVRTFSIAQFPEFGKIDAADLREKACPIDKNADAMVLFDYQWVKCVPEGYTMKIVVEKRVRVKIFKEKGFKHANIKIPYFNRSKQTKMKEISGIIFNLDTSGKVIVQKIDRKQIFKNKAEDNVSSVNFTFPGVKAGSVIEYRYTQVDHDSYIITPWAFQSLIPVMEAYCNITAPGWQRVNYRIKSAFPIQKDDPSDIANSGTQEEKILRLSTKNIPAFVEEPFMTSFIDNFPRVEFSMRGYYLNRILDKESQWGILNVNTMNSVYFGQAIAENIKGTEGLLDTLKKLNSKEEQVSFLYYYLQKNVKWNKRRGIYAYDLAEAWKNKSGSTAAINLIFLNLLKKLKIECSPILVSTRENGIIDIDFPSLSQFNGVNTWVNDSTINWLMDPSIKNIAHNLPPPNVLNRNGFALDSLNGSWVYLSDKRPLAKTMVSVDAKFDSAFNLNGEAFVSLHDYAKAEALEENEKDDDDLSDNEKQDRELKRIELTTYDHTQEGGEDPLKPLTEKFKFKYLVTNTNELYYFEPNFLTALTKNPFVASNRHTDIDMGSNQYFSFSILIELPKNMEFEVLPAPILLRNSDTSIVFRRISAIENNKALLKFTLELNNALIPKEEYLGLKEYYKKLYSLLSEQIVVRRKSS